MDAMQLFTTCQKVVDTLPEALGRAVFTAAGLGAGLVPSGGRRQLVANYRRVLGREPKLREVTTGYVRYMRYYYEAMRLKSLDADDFRARVTCRNGDRLAREIEAGEGCVGALFHAGNWDLAGAWASSTLHPVHTIAEKLEPPELFEYFCEMRSRVGMTIYPLVKGANTLGTLQEDMRTSGAFVPLLADRDISRNGVIVDLCGHPASMAAGPALLALRTGLAIIPIFCRYEKLGRVRRRVAGTRHGMELECGKAVESPTAGMSDAERRDLAERDPRWWAEQVQSLTQAWARELEKFLTAYPTDWHMLQKVFTADLDPQRLAQREAAARHEATARHEAAASAPATPTTPPEGVQ